MRRLLPPVDSGPTHALTVDELEAHYAYPDDGAVRANMVTSVDGAVSLHGSSKPISGAADWYLFGLQRALADVVLVGAGTARSEGYGPGRARAEFAHLRQAAGQPPAPTIAVVTRTGAIDPDASFLAGPQRAVVITCEAASDRVAALRGVADVVFAGGDTVALQDALGELNSRGMRRVLTEGGPTLLGSLATDDLIDELVTTLSPALVAGDSPRMVHAGAAGLRPLRLVGLLEEDGVLFTHYRRDRGTS
jgi:riboflavin biosynthesis pyrimidine reductase